MVQKGGISTFFCEPVYRDDLAGPGMAPFCTEAAALVGDRRRLALCRFAKGVFEAFG
jgi:hypothetical protein